ncbi:hypothetical protein RRG08_059442 [Elysia crispata]|uniref:Uncharacterized protein n=1 Tax=Elysia crispata TaxID=231223 RepID=A0AAE1A4H9_9GAST|nr:hypothetical protein RRG08_059442 [Elysia crispata]
MTLGASRASQTKLSGKLPGLNDFLGSTLPSASRSEIGHLYSRTLVEMRCGRPAYNCMAWGEETDTGDGLPRKER